MRGWIKELLKPSDAPLMPLPGGSMEPPRRGGGRVGLAMLEPEPGDGAEHRPLMPKHGRYGISSVISKISSGVSGVRDLVLRKS